MLLRRSIALLRRGGKPHRAAAVSQIAGLPQGMLSPGMHLVTSRLGYLHHGIYIGRGMVVHYSGLCQLLHSGPVEEVTLSRFSMGRAVRIVEHSESKYSPEEIVLRARSRLGEHEYHVLRNNCEHFCNWCISGRSRSTQVERPLASTLRALVIAVLRRPCWVQFAALAAVTTVVSGVCSLASAAPELPVKKQLTLEVANQLADAAQAEAEKRNATVVITVVDDGGYPIVLRRLDNTQVASVQVGIDKARTAAIYRRPSKDFEEQVKNGRVSALALAGGVALQGGLPIKVDGVVIGAISASGNTPQEDEDIAAAGLAALEAPRVATPSSCRIGSRK